MALGRFDRIVDRVMDDVRNIRDQRKDQDIIPFGTEQVSKREAQNRVRNMTPAQRRALVQQMGPDKVMELF